MRKCITFIFRSLSSVFLVALIVLLTALFDFLSFNKLDSICLKKILAQTQSYVNIKFFFQYINRGRPSTIEVLKQFFLYFISQNCNTHFGYNRETRKLYNFNLFNKYVS